MSSSDETTMSSQCIGDKFAIFLLYMTYILLPCESTAVIHIAWQWAFVNQTSAYTSRMLREIRRRCHREASQRHPESIGDVEIFGPTANFTSGMCRESIAKALPRHRHDIGRASPMLSGSLFIKTHRECIRTISMLALNFCWPLWRHYLILFNTYPRLISSRVLCEHIAKTSRRHPRCICS